MSLRSRMFLMLGGLVALLVLAQWWLVRSLSSDLDTELDSVALSVGSSVAWLLDDSRQGEGALICPDGDCAGAEPRVQVFRYDLGPPLQPESPSTGPSGQMHLEIAPEAGVHARTIIVHRPEAHVSPELPEATGVGRATVHPLGEPHQGLLQAEELSREAADISLRLHLEQAPEDRFLVVDLPQGAAGVPIPRQGLEQRLIRFRRQLLMGSGALLVLGLAAAAAVSHRMTAPLRRLAAAAQQVGDGALGVQVSDRQADRDVGHTIAAFNHMSRRLEDLDRQTRRLAALQHLGEIGDVARGLAHTLRNPLNALGLTVDALAAAPQVAGDELAVTARRQIRRIDRGIRSFLLLASPSGGLTGPVDLTQLARDVALEALQDCDGRVRLPVTAADGLEPLLDGVEAELRAVVQALVVNAVEASPPGAAVRVHLEPGAAGRKRLWVDDRGAGLAGEVRRRLFTPHVSTKANGSGMGLFLAHRIAVLRYGGELELLDRPGGGTRVRLELGRRRSSPLGGEGP